jgi:hypothetical protein
LFALQDCHFICILEDDLKPIKKGWFETYEKASKVTGINHFCRVQNKEVPETIESFTSFMQSYELTPIYGPSPRGDLTFITQKVLRKVGAFNPKFKGAGYAHGEWSNRVANAYLIGHPLKWIDIKEARDSFIQVGDTEGGRWEDNKDKLKGQLRHNDQVYQELKKTNYIYHPLVLE